MLDKIKAKKYVRELIGIAKNSATRIPILNENRDFVEFELMFYFYFVYDYKVYHGLDSALRKAISDLFIEYIYNPRKGSLSRSEFDGFYDNRIGAYFTFVKQSEKKGEFIDRASDYINAMITISINENGYAYGSLDALPEIKKEIVPNIFTKFIYNELCMSSLLII